MFLFQRSSFYLLQPFKEKIQNTKLINSKYIKLNEKIKYMGPF